jgi:hypothetical protein
MSQHILCSSTIFICARTKGWRSTVISLISTWKILSSVSSRLCSSVTRLKAKLVCKSINALSIRLVPPIPICCRVDCHVIDRNSIWSLWATARKVIKSHGPTVTCSSEQSTLRSQTVASSLVSNTLRVPDRCWLQTPQL